MNFWNDPELRTGGNFITFATVGDTITGEIIAQRKHTFDDGKIVPQIDLNVDGVERTLTAGQVRLKAALAEQCPTVGDVLTVTLKEIEKRAGGKTLKHFDVLVNGAPASAPTAAPVAAAPAASEAELAAARNLLGL